MVDLSLDSYQTDVQFLLVQHLFQIRVTIGSEFRSNCLGPFLVNVADGPESILIRELG